jgi:protein SCO1/2
VPRLVPCALVLAALGCVRPPDLPRIAEVPAFSLRDQNGRELRRERWKGSVWIASFLFTSCKDVCPLLTSKMSGLRTRLAPERGKILFVSFSVDPEHDTPAALKQYARKHDADQPDWTFLTGPVDAIEQIVVKGFKQSVQRQPGQVGKGQAILHGSHFVLVDRGMYIRGYYPSDQEGLLRLERDARIVLAGRPVRGGGS